MKRVGIYAGSFDPVHNGHLQFARDALEQCNLEKIFFLVEPTPRRKQGVKAFEHRVKMVQRAVRGMHDFGVIVTEQQQFTVSETIPFLMRRFKNAHLSMLLGEDVLEHLTGWPNVEHLLENIEIIVGVRSQSVPHVEAILATIIKTRSIPLEYKIIETSARTISSSKVRHAFRTGKISADVPVTVARYIEKERLYTSSSESES